MIVYFVAKTAYSIESNPKLHAEEGCDWGVLLSYIDARSTVKNKRKCGKQFRNVIKYKQKFKEELNNGAN
jgi:hypothetical protein